MIVQRFRQGIAALLAFARDVDYDLAAQYLTPQQLALFKQMARAEQLHSLNVLRDVLAQADKTPHDLALAALMHDVGKSKRHLSVVQKTISVIIKSFFPEIERRLTAEENVDFWHAPFTVRRYHPKWSAELLMAVGASETAIWLARHHQDQAGQWHNHPNYALLCRLQQADDAN